MVIAEGRLVGLMESIFDEQDGKHQTWRLARAISSAHFAEWLTELIAADQG